MLLICISDGIHTQDFPWDQGVVQNESEEEHELRLLVDSLNLFVLKLRF